MENKGESIKETGLRLLKQGQKGLVHAIFSRFGIILLLFALQLFLLLGIFFWFQSFSYQLFLGGIVLSLCVTLYILNTGIDPTAKLTWVVLVMALPAFGTLLFLFTNLEIGHRTFRDNVEKVIESTKNIIPQDEKVLSAFTEKDPGAASIAKYLGRTGCFPIFDNTRVTYLPVGEDMFAALLEELKKAKDFIFLEYFIIDEGIMWGKILEILAEKAKEGVDVRVTYDGTNEFSSLPRSYPKMLEKLGIKCKVFAPLTPFISTHYNYRDHRKIMVIDGKTAFTGGINFADRYINKESVYGHWKDTAVMLKGDAVKGFTLLFLQTWNIRKTDPEFDRYLKVENEDMNSKGFVIPYGDCPLDKDKVGEMVYCDILNRSQRYVHIMTPYLIIDGEMETAIKFAAERGVEVSLILPGVPDKLSAYSLAKSHYEALINAGVNVYEYTPGFVHAKSFVADDKEAVVGTINLDYRSLYHHFECAAYCYETECISDIEKDFEDTLKKCRKVTKETIWEKRKGLKLAAFFLKVVAPLL